MSIAVAIQLNILRINSLRGLASGLSRGHDEDRLLVLIFRIGDRGAVSSSINLLRRASRKAFEEN